MSYKNKLSFNINLTPLIDISFILIIILFQSYKNREQSPLVYEKKINLIKSKNNSPVILNEKFTILQINKKKQIFINQILYSLEEDKFKNKLKSLDKELPFYLVFDKTISVEFLFKIYDKIQKQNIKNIKILTHETSNKKVNS